MTASLGIRASSRGSLRSTPPMVLGFLSSALAGGGLTGPDTSASAAASEAAAAAPATGTGHPTGLKFFFWGEFAERCSYYGMRGILTLYLTTKLAMSDDRANEWYATFKMACYFLPLLGGFLADRFFGKYWTIVGFSVPYVVGQLLIGGGVDTESTVFLALALCAMGSG